MCIHEKMSCAPAWFRRRSKSGSIRSGVSAKVNVSDNKYEVVNNKGNGIEIPRGVGGKKDISWFIYLCIY